MIFIIFDNIFFKQKEGFSTSDIKNMFGEVKKITKTVKDVPTQISKIDDKLTQKVTQLGETIQKNTVNILTNKLKNVFKELGNVLNDGIVKPITQVFVGIGNIFMQIFNIFKEIGDKIVSLPNCIFTYAIKSTIDSVYFFYKKIMPKFIQSMFSFIYYYILSYIFDFIGYITGYDDSVKKCYGFNVSTEVDKIKNNLGKIQSSFKNDFGRLNFSKIKI